MKFVMKVILIFFSMISLSAQDNRIPATGFAVFSGDGQFKPYEFTRHPVGDNDIQIEILYAGICHSDLHHVREEWGKEEFPMVPGHEIAGRVVKVGKNVTKFKVGDYAGVGCMVNSCGNCEFCKTIRNNIAKMLCLHITITISSTIMKLHKAVIQTR